MRSAHRAPPLRRHGGDWGAGARAATAAREAEATPRREPLRVLLVDEAPHSRDALAELLRDEGYHVECAESADTALARLERWRPDVVLTDVASAHLADGSLLDVAPARLPGAHVVVMTPFLDPQTRAQITARGITACALPLDLPALLDRLSSWEADRSRGLTS